MSKIVIVDCFDSCLPGRSPQKVIKILTDIINRTPINDRRYLKIESYYETYGNPFEQNPDKKMRIVIEKQVKSTVSET